MATQTLVVPRDSYGRELTPQENAEREQKIQKLMSGGRDRWSAENIADGRPEWSQRIDCSSNVTQSPVYLASKALNDASPKPDRETLSELQDRLDKIKFQIGEHRRKKDDAGSRVQRGKRVLADVQKFLKYIEDKRDDLGYAADKQRCDEVTAKVKLALELDEHALGVATGLLARYEKELKEFPHDKLQRLREEENMRDRIRV